MTDAEFRLAVERYGDMLFRLAYSCTRSRADAEDVMQETLLKLYTAQKAFESPDHEKNWLDRVAVNERRHLPKLLRTAAIAAVMAMALAVTAGAVNYAMDGALFRKFRIIAWSGEDTLLAQDEEGNQVHITVDSDAQDLVTRENGRLILHADQNIDITEALEETGAYHYTYEVLAVWEDGSWETRTVTIDVTGDLDDWTVTRGSGAPERAA